jgi:hypothetical protein
MSIFHTITSQFGRKESNRLISRQRLETCKKCKFFVESTRSCGTIYVGDDVTYNKKKYHLCGCHMPLKVQFPWSECSVGKWKSSDGFDIENLVEVKQVLEDYTNKPDRGNSIRVNSVFKKLLGDAGHDINPTQISCGACVRNRVAELKHYVKKVEKC